MLHKVVAMPAHRNLFEWTDYEGTQKTLVH